MRNFLFFSLMLTSALLSGCTSKNPYTGEEQFSKTGVSTTVGAIGGGIIGSLVSGGKASGAVIGASIGAVSGAVVGKSLDRQEEILRNQLQRTGVKVIKRNNEIQLVMPGDITFEQSSSQIRASFYDVLNSIVLVLKEYDNTQVSINGYASSEGSPSFNQELSERRAQSIAQYFKQNGITSSRLIDKGFGARYPIASNKTEAGRKLNRRVTISIREQ